MSSMILPIPKSAILKTLFEIKIFAGLISLWIILCWYKVLYPLAIYPAMLVASSTVNQVLFFFFLSINYFKSPSPHISIIMYNEPFSSNIS